MIVTEQPLYIHQFVFTFVEFLLQTNFICTLYMEENQKTMKQGFIVLNPLDYIAISTETLLCVLLIFYIKKLSHLSSYQFNLSFFLILQFYHYRYVWLFD